MNFIKKRYNRSISIDFLLGLVQYWNSKMSVSIAEELYSVKNNNKQKQLAQIISSRHLSLRKSRKLIEDQFDGCKDTMTSDYSIYQNKTGYDDEPEKAQKLFDKSIVALRIAMIRLVEVIEGMHNNWILYEILMQHKNMLHSQIDLLIRQRNKIPNNKNCI
jgi:ParB family chromosome partitioning protein